MVIRVKISAIRDVENEANLFEGKPGDVVTLYSKEAADAEFTNHTRIVATVFVTGDERGTRVWVRKIAAAK